MDICGLMDLIDRCCTVSGRLTKMYYVDEDLCNYFSRYDPSSETDQTHIVLAYVGAATAHDILCDYLDGLKADVDALAQGLEEMRVQMTGGKAE